MNANGQVFTSTENSLNISEFGGEIDRIVIEKAYQILSQGDLVKARRDYIAKSVYGGEHAINMLTYVGHSAYLGGKYVIHADMIGDPQIGKSTSVDKSLDLMPEEDVISLTELSPKYIYYKAKDTDFEGKIIYIDDIRDDHIPIIKTLRNDTRGRQCHGTVIDGEAVDLEINGRPAVIGSCVKPLRDLQGQASSRAFQVPNKEPSKEIEDNIHETIRRGIGKGAMKSISGWSQEKLVLQQASRILRDCGLRGIVVPFDASEPKGSGRRATAQFVRLIIISAFIHQYQRPVLHIDNGIFVLATYDDLVNALDILEGLGASDQLKIAPKGIELLKLLPVKAPDSDDGPKSKDVMTSLKLHELTGIPERTITDQLCDLYEVGAASRQKLKAQGSPYAYWTDPEISKKVNGGDSADTLAAKLSNGAQREPGSLKYGSEYSPESLKASISSFFERVRDMGVNIILNLGQCSNANAGVSPEEHYLKAWATGLKIEAEHGIEIQEKISSLYNSNEHLPDIPAVDDLSAAS